MLSYINTPFNLGSLQLKHRLIQGPLAGYSCAPFRELFSLFVPPAYCVSEMISAHDVVDKHSTTSRYLYRSPQEHVLCYQIAGRVPHIMAEAASKLEELGADIIDINCGCPKAKIRKKGAGSALLEDLTQLLQIVKAVRSRITCPLTVKIRLQYSDADIELARAMFETGVDGLIIHGRRWQDDYDKPCNFDPIDKIRQAVTIPIIVNGDVSDQPSLERAFQTSADAFMISRAGTGKPWLYQELLTALSVHINDEVLVEMFFRHLESLANLEGEHQAVLQSKSLIRYYFKERLPALKLSDYYQLDTLSDIGGFLKSLFNVNSISYAKS